MDDSSSEAPIVPLGALTDGKPGRHDLFMGLVAPIGSSSAEVIEELRTHLMPYGYGMERIHLAGLLDDLPSREGEALPSREHPDYYTAHMNAGDTLRKSVGDDSALAAVAIARVAGRRDAAASAASQPVVYVFDSLKHPREAQLLRNVYGSGFWLVSIVEDISEREHNFAKTRAGQLGNFGVRIDAEVHALMHRDEADLTAEHGQQVRDVFADADFFLPVKRGEIWASHIQRFLEGVFDAPFLTPNADEEAMRHAQAASLRSAALGRQVGAAIVPASGDPYLLGTNEVPKPGGGQFREGDSPDFRDFRSGHDPNTAYVDRLLVEVFDRLAKAKFFSEDRNDLGGAKVLEEAKRKNGDQPAVLDNTRAKSIIEFTRCLHAEQAAIVSAARTGVALAGSSLYTTTFPCHECTKFIIGAGILEVQYIEPYPKSLAGELYRDLIDPLPPMTKNADSKHVEKIPFRPFIGFGPGRYDEVFSAAKRKDGQLIVNQDKLASSPIGRDWNGVGVKNNEDLVVVAISSQTKHIPNREDIRTDEVDKGGSADDATPGTGTVGE
ncbi:hypothetical protein CBI33_07510 [Rhodococcus erythropolis]|nr:hypothetical protein CBI33_07510 [Rhodococcus erythropolis]